MATPDRAIIVAEIGSTWGRDLDVALRLIDDVTAAGADVVKAQWLSSAQALADRRGAYGYIGQYGLLEYPVKWLAEMSERCHARGARFACTAYLAADVRPVACFADVVKVASFEAGDLVFVGHAATVCKEETRELVVSTGMMSLTEAHGVAVIAGRITVGLTLLHCVSAYPTPDDQAALGGIEALRRRIGPSVTRIGYSDHTATLMTGALAVMAGATMLEKHVRPVVADPANPDVAFGALMPGDFGQYVAAVRMAEAMRGPIYKAPQPCEAEMMKYRAWTRAFQAY